MAQTWGLAVALAGAVLGATTGCSAEDGNGGGSGAADGSGGTTGSGGSTGGGGAVTTVTTHDDYLRAIRTSYCERLARCPMPNDDTLGMWAILGTIERCEQFYAELSSRSPYFRDRVDAVADGRILFDAEAARECLSATLDSPAAVDSALAACRGVYRGSVPEGSECYRHEECAGNAYCGSATWSCPGVCTPYAAPGSPCDVDVVCDPTSGFAVCDYAAAEPVCLAFSLRLDAQLGEVCGVLPSGEYVTCACGLWCNGYRGESGTCQEPIPLGTPCDDIDEPCAEGGFCTGPEGATQCRMVTVQTEVGAPCDEEGGIPATMCDPLANLGCVGGFCEYLGEGSDGSGCIPSDWGDTTCRPGLYCDYNWSDPTVPAVCRPLRSAGQPCSGSGMCEVACDDEAGVCTDRYCAL